jgi:hypothetical protein
MATYEIVSNATVKSVADTVCSMLSLPLVQDPAGSRDPNMVLLMTAMNLASAELLNAFEWPTLTKMASILVEAPASSTPPATGNAIELSFDLPEDFFRFVDQTQWNGAMRFPAVGPVSPQGWMTYMVFPVSAKIWFLNPPPAPGQEFRFMYLSRAMVQNGTNPDLYSNIARNDNDVFQLDGLLISLLTRVKWLEAKGFDSSAAMRDFYLAFDSRVGAEKGANILNLAGNRGGYPYIGIGNLPDASLYGMRQW